MRCGASALSRGRKERYQMPLHSYLRVSASRRAEWRQPLSALSTLTLPTSTVGESLEDCAFNCAEGVSLRLRTHKVQSTMAVGVVVILHQPLHLVPSIPALHLCPSTAAVRSCTCTCACNIESRRRNPPTAFNFTTVLECLCTKAYYYLLGRY